MQPLLLKAGRAPFRDSAFAAGGVAAGAPPPLPPPDEGGEASGGVESWRALLRGAASRGVALGGLLFSRKRHHGDVYADIYSAELRAAFADTFCPPPRAPVVRARGALPTAWAAGASARVL